MQEHFYEDMRGITAQALAAVRPEAAVRKALAAHSFAPGRIRLVAVGKAAWQMAEAAVGVLGSRIEKGIVITKYGHSAGPLPGLLCREAAHPVPDQAGFAATREALELVSGLGAEDTVLFLLSGGASALFEQPLVEPEELQSVTGALLACGCDIAQINTIRKRLSGVKGGRFALRCAPAQVFTVALSDVVGDAVDMIASGPTCPDSSTCAQALEIAEKYALPLSARGWELLREETPKALSNSTVQVTGSVRQLCAAAAKAAADRGYRPIILTDCLTCEAREAGAFLASIAETHRNTGEKLAFLAGGETVVHLKGSGLGGRNQEIALAAAKGLRGLHAAVFSLGSDGTDGPTDAAGGYADGDSYDALLSSGIRPETALDSNDSYHALRSVGGLIITGPTGTNVNDVSVLLIAP